MPEAFWILFLILLLLVVLALAKTVQIVPQARAGIVERFGKYRTTLPAGLNIVVPFIDKVRYMIDLREQVVSFPPQPVITEDNLVVSIDTVIYFQVTDAVSATYEIANYIQAVEQLTMTTLRNIVGGMDLEETLTSREDINAGLRTVLDEATGKWGIRVNRVEIKGIDPPPSIKDAMEKQMRADRDKRAVVLTAEGERQSAILTAEGNKQSAILNAEGEREAAILRAEAERQSRILRAQGEGQAIHDGLPGHPRRPARPVAAGLPVPPDAARRSPRATPTRSGSCPRRSARRSRGSAPRWAPSPASRRTDERTCGTAVDIRRDGPSKCRGRRAGRRVASASADAVPPSRRRRRSRRGTRHRRPDAPGWHRRGGSRAT